MVGGGERGGGYHGGGGGGVGTRGTDPYISEGKSSAATARDSKGKTWKNLFTKRNEGNKKN